MYYYTIFCKVHPLIHFGLVVLVCRDMCKASNVSGITDSSEHLCFNPFSLFGPGGSEAIRPGRPAV